MSARRYADRPELVYPNAFIRKEPTQRFAQSTAAAQAACVAASLMIMSAELDSVRIWPLIEALASASDRVEEPRDLYVT